jgi:hypothetical protein
VLLSLLAEFPWVSLIWGFSYVVFVPSRIIILGFLLTLDYLVLFSLFSFLFLLCFEFFGVLQILLVDSEIQNFWVLWILLVNSEFQFYNDFPGDAVLSAVIFLPASLNLWLVWASCCTPVSFEVPVFGTFLAV